MLRWCLSTVRTTGGTGSVFYQVVRSSTAAKNAIHHPHEVKLISETKENTILDTCEVSEDVSLRIGSTPKAVVLPPKWPNAVGRGGVLLSEDTSLTVLPIPFVEQGVAEPIPETEPVVSLSPDNSQDDPTDGINPANITSTLIPTSAMIYPCPSQPTLDEPIDTSALQTMKLILSSDYLHSSALNSIPTPRIIRSLYTSMKSRSQLNQLTPLEFSSLINLFGGLSHLSYSQSNSEMYGFGQMRDLIRKIAKREGEAKKGSRTYWPFVTLLVSDKQRVMMGRLEVVDRCWAMRAELALLEGGEGAQDDTNRRSQAIQRARDNYNVVSGFTSHPDAHCYFLNLLLDSSRLSEREEGIRALYRVLRWPGPCHPRLLELLWKVVLGPEDKVSSKTMGLMLSVVKKRMRKVAGRVGGKSSTIRKARVVGSGGDVSRAMETPELLQPEGLAALLRDHIFSSPLDVVDPELQGWIKDTICSTLCLDQGDRTYAFSHLVLMGTIASSSPPTSLSPNFPNINLPMKTNDFSTDFRVLHILAILERIASGKKGRDFGQLYEDNSEKINSVLMSLWESWVSSSLSRPKRVSSTIVASFVYLAGRTNNPSFMKLCGELYLSEDTLSPHSYSVWVEYVLALVGIGSTSEGVLRVLDAIPEYRSRVTTEVLRRIALGDSAFAHDLFLQTKQTGIQVPDDTVLELVAALIRDGHLNLVVSFLERPTSKARRLQTLTMLCQAIPHHPEYISSSEVAGRIASAIMDLSPATIRKQCPRRPLKITLQNIARAEQVSSAIAAHLHITSRHPRWFPPSCYTPLLQYALKQRRFKDAFRLFENANMAYPKISGFWCRLLIQQFSRAGASKLAQKLMMYLKPGEKRNPSIAVARHMGFQELKPSRVGTIRLPSFLSSPRRNQNIDVNDPRHILQLLTRAGRHSAAIKLFGRVRQEYSPGIQTALGNIILNASLRRSPRYGHGRMRQTLSTLKLLISKHDFKPDRISVNILIKAILLWKQEVDWYVVRALFDRMVRGGYPMGGIVGLGEVPFGTEDGEMVLGGVVLPKLDSRVDFRRHVRPLYRMFVKALFLRGDEVGARRVVGILKLVETEVRRGRGGEGRG